MHRACSTQSQLRVFNDVISPTKHSEPAPLCPQIVLPRGKVAKKAAR